MKNYHIPLKPEGVYHLYARAIGKERMFREEENYEYFLNKVFDHLYPVMDLYSYALIPNHFHLLARIKPLQDLDAYYRSIKHRGELCSVRAPGFVMQQVSNLLNGYCKAFNRRFKRMGGLFIPARRVRMETVEQLKRTCRYIHQNPVKHKLVEDFREWNWTSYATLVDPGPSIFLKKDELLEAFGGAGAFSAFHSLKLGEIVQP